MLALEMYRWGCFLKGLEGAQFEETVSTSYLRLLQPAGCDSCQVELLFTKIYPS